MKLNTVMAVALVLVLASSVFAYEKKAYTMRDDFGTQPLSDCTLNYYYYIPCPTSSWFWAVSGWTYGDNVGVFFQVGDLSMFYDITCDPINDHVLEQFRFLDFAGYGTQYPGLFTVEFNVYCCDEAGCPMGPSLWNSGPVETHFAWNYVVIEPPISICDCCVEPGPPPQGPRILITSTQIGTENSYPAWGFDSVSGNYQRGCIMHDYGCAPALFPRPTNSHYNTIHTGYYGVNMRYCPPLWFCDFGDTTQATDSAGSRKSLSSWSQGIVRVFHMLCPRGVYRIRDTRTPFSVWRRFSASS